MRTQQRGTKKEKPALATQARPKTQTMKVHHPPIVRRLVVITKVFTNAALKKPDLRCYRLTEVRPHYITPQIQVNTISHYTGG